MEITSTPPSRFPVPNAAGFNTGTSINLNLAIYSPEKSPSPFRTPIARRIIKTPKAPKKTRTTHPRVADIKEDVVMEDAFVA